MTASRCTFSGKNAAFRAALWAVNPKQFNDGHRFLLFDGTQLFMLDIYKSPRLSRPATKGEDGSPESFDRKEDI
jgi:hypothetical protein